MKKTYVFDYISLSSSQNEKCFRKKVQRKSKHTYYVNYLFIENHAVCGIAWKMSVEPHRTQIIIWLMRVTCRISKARNRHSDYVILIAFPLQQLLSECLSMLRYTYIAFLICITNNIQKMCDI
jgi:hypothetical protein